MSILKKIFNIFINSHKFKIIDDNNLCPICDSKLFVEYTNVIPKELAIDWKLSEYEIKQFNLREGELCKNCGSSLRLRNIAHSILIAYNARNITLKKLIQTKLSNYFIAEINYCGQLHNLLALNKNLYYSEFGSKNEFIRHEDLMALSYSDSMFDLLLNTDVLEHVPDIDTSISEISRVLKKNGIFIFTVPIIFERETLQRAILNEENEIEFIESKSFHGEYALGSLDYLVFYEFGKDIIKKLKVYFDITIVKEKDDIENLRTVFICKKIN